MNVTVEATDREMLEGLPSALDTATLQMVNKSGTPLREAGTVSKSSRKISAYGRHKNHLSVCDGCRLLENKHIIP